MRKGTFIKVDRKILEWRWFKDKNTLQIFLFLLLKANIADMPFENIVIRRGELVTSLNSLSNATGQTVNEVRTALKHLKATGEITSTNYSKYQVISIVNYSLYQGSAQAASQSFHRHLTASEEYKNSKKLTTTESGEEKEAGKKVRKEEDKNYIPHASYGVFCNVFLSEEEYKELLVRYPETARKSIEGFSRYLKATGKQFESHYARLLGWCEEDESRFSKPETPVIMPIAASYDIKRAEERARTAIPKVKKRERR